MGENRTGEQAGVGEPVIQFKPLGARESRDIDNDLCGPVAVKMLQHSRANTMSWYGYVQDRQKQHLWTTGLLPKTMSILAREMGMRRVHYHVPDEPYTPADGVGKVLDKLATEGYKYALMDVATYGGWHAFAVVAGVIRDASDWRGSISSCRVAYARKTPPRILVLKP